MKKLNSIIIFTLLFSCNTKQEKNKSFQDKNQTNNNTELKVQSSTDTIKSIEKEISSYQISEFDNLSSKSTLRLKEDLKKLANENLFIKTHSKLEKKLPEKHQEYFRENTNYNLIYTTYGNLFNENKNDYVFVVYDNKNIRISILMYNEQINKYGELFRDVKVENGLENANCNYGYTGTVDSNLAEEFIQVSPGYFTHSIMKDNLDEIPLPCKIVNIANDDDMILEDGCFSSKVSKQNKVNSLCIATSFVYNNWECLQYNKKTNTFLIFYGQAFAD